MSGPSAVSVQGYEVLGVLDESGSGKLYKARQVSLDRLVALKILPAADASDPAFVERFRNEAKAVSTLRHPNVVAVCDQGTDAAGTHYVAFEYVEGPTGETLVTRLTALPERDALELCYGVALALACAEEHKIVHRDVQPANMLVTKEGVPKLIELGLAKRSGDIASTAVGKLLKNAHYVSPEQALGLGELDTRSDLYALGICLYRFVTGRFPFEGTDGLTIVTRHVNEDVPDPRDVNPQVSEGVAKLIAGLSSRDPADRYPSARAACLDFTRVCDGQEALGPLGAEEAARGAPQPRPSDSSVLAGLLSRSSAKLAAELNTEEEVPVRFGVQVYTGDVLLKEHDFDQDLVIIGRGKDCEIHLDNPIVSRRHAEVHRSGTQLALVALPTTNGTTVDGTRVSELTPITERSRVLVADKFRLVFRIEKALKKPVEAAPEPEPTEEEADTTSFRPQISPDPDDPLEALTPMDRPTIPVPAAQARGERPTARRTEEEATSPYGVGAGSAPASPYGGPVAASPYGEAEPSPYGEEAPSPYGGPSSTGRAAPPSPDADASPAAGADADASPYRAATDSSASTDRAAAPPAERAAPARAEAERPQPARAPTPAADPPTARREVHAARAAMGRAADTPGPMRRPSLPVEPREARPGEPALVFERNGKEQRVACGDVLQLGKANECELRVQGTFAPRKAALLLKTGDGYRVYNVGPAPDTVSLNGSEVVDQAPLRSGDRLSVYGLEVRFEG